MEKAGGASLAKGFSLGLCIAVREMNSQYGPESHRTTSTSHLPDFVRYLLLPFSWARRKKRTQSGYVFTPNPKACVCWRKDPCRNQGEVTECFLYAWAQPREVEVQGPRNTTLSPKGGLPDSHVSGCGLLACWLYGYPPCLLAKAGGPFCVRTACWCVPPSPWLGHGRWSLDEPGCRRQELGDWHRLPSCLKKAHSLPGFCLRWEILGPIRHFVLYH